MIIELLKIISTDTAINLPDIAHKLNISVISALSLIAKIKQREPELIIEQAGKYQLTRKINWLDNAQLDKHLTEKNLAHSYVILKEIDSTNTYALNHIENLKSPTIITTELQNNGRGRFGRRWSSKIAHDITVSILYQLPREFNLPILPIIIAVAMNRLFKNYRINNQIKWPNDIYANNEKICGILVENILRNDTNNTVIGIGLNNIGAWERSKLLIDIAAEVDNLIREYQLFGFALLRREWLDNCLHYQQEVTLLQNGQAYVHGKHNDIGEKGELILHTHDGIQRYSSSALSLQV